LTYYFAKYKFESSISHSSNTVRVIDVVIRLWHRVMFICCLQSFYVEKFGPGIVEIVKDSNDVEREKLDPNKV